MCLLRLGCGRRSLSAIGGDAYCHRQLGRGMRREGRREALLRHRGERRRFALLLPQQVEHRRLHDFLAGDLAQPPLHLEV